MSNRIKVAFPELKPFLGDKQERIERSGLFLFFMFFNIFRQSFTNKVFFRFFESCTGNVNIVAVSAVTNFEDEGVFGVLSFQDMSCEAVGDKVCFKGFSHFGNLLFGKNDFRRNRGSSSIFVRRKIGLLFLDRIEKAGK